MTPWEEKEITEGPRNSARIVAAFIEELSSYDLLTSDQVYNMAMLYANFLFKAAAARGGSDEQ